MNRNEFNRFVAGGALPGPGDLEGLRELTVLFPWFHSAHLVLLRGLKENADVRFDSQLKASALSVSDREVLYHYLFMSPEAEVAGRKRLHRRRSGLKKRCRKRLQWRRRDLRKLCRRRLYREESCTRGSCHEEAARRRLSPEEVAARRKLSLRKLHTRKLSLRKSAHEEAVIEEVVHRRKLSWRKSCTEEAVMEEVVHRRKLS